MHPRRRRLAWIWTLVVLIACSVPGTALPETSSTLPLDKLVHFGLFFVFGYAWRRGGLGLRWLLAAGGLYALVLEPFQGLVVPNRQADLYDALTNLAGLAAGAAAGPWGERDPQRKQTVGEDGDPPGAERTPHAVGTMG